MFSTINGEIVYERHGHALPIERIDPERARQALEQAGYRLAAAIANGALNRSIDARSLARQVGLLAPIDTTAARAAGLIGERHDEIGRLAGQAVCDTDARWELARRAAVSDSIDEEWIGAV